ncbi:MAG: redoxin domain-containing protein [Bacteroidales bacterium]|nr:redoxin domain-containing protein [Bacteroidales bacterium]
MKKQFQVLLFFLLMLVIPLAISAQESTKESIVDNKGRVVIMDKKLFLEKVFDYTESDSWSFLGDKPVIIDLYADWCGPCRKTAPIMERLAKEYADDIIIYKVNVDKEQELAAFFNASSIPLFVFIPKEGQPQLFRGAANHTTYKKVIDEFLLKK